MLKGSKITGKKKKIIIILCCVAVVFAVISLIVHQTTKITNESYANCSIGDVNGDGFINASDSLLIIQDSSKDKLFDNQKRLADVNQDGQVNSADVLILHRYAVGDIKKIPYIEGVQDDAHNIDNSRSAEYETEKSLSIIQIMNEWDNDDGTHSYQFSVSVKNTGNDEIGGWSTKITLSNPVSLSKSWDCKCKENSDEIIVRNASIPTESTAVCGFIVTAPDGLTITGIKTVD